MRSLIRLVGLVLALFLSSCASGEDAWDTRDADLRALEELVIPDDAERRFITLRAAAPRAWTVRDVGGQVDRGDEIRATVGCPVVLVLRSDHPVRLSIPAVRFDELVTPGEAAVGWFMPVVPGVYDVQVRSATEQFDGRLVVVGGAR